jgi:hypothetical protein
MVVETELTQLVAGPIYAHAWNKTKTGILVACVVDRLFVIFSCSNLPFH